MVFQDPPKSIGFETEVWIESEHLVLLQCASNVSLMNLKWAPSPLDHTLLSNSLLTSLWSTLLKACIEVLVLYQNGTSEDQVFAPAVVVIVT